MCAFDSAFPSACAICYSCLSISICGRKPAGTEDAPKRSEESLVKSDQDGDCRWTTGSRRLGTTPTTTTMTDHEGKQVLGLVQCCGVERIHEGKPSMTVQRQTSSEQYVFLSQGQAKRPAQLVAMHWAHMVEANNEIAEPRPGYSPGPAYGNAL